MIKKFFNHPWFMFRLQLLVVLYFFAEFVFTQNIGSLLVAIIWTVVAIQNFGHTRQLILRDTYIEAQDKLIEQLLDLSRVAIGHLDSVEAQEEIRNLIKKYNDATKV
jgi:hypothetical protein